MSGPSSAGGAGRRPVGGALQGLAVGLGFAASPTFALMAVLTELFGRDPMALLCGGGGFALGGMVPMYGLMAAFHLGPWLRLVPGGPAAPARG